MTSAELKEARLRLGLTQTQMADALATSARTYQGWEAGRYEIPGPVSLAIKWVQSAKKHSSKSPRK
jgi:DNA-binding transcriptional regulator YiaG